MTKEEFNKVLSSYFSEILETNRAKHNETYSKIKTLRASKESHFKIGEAGFFSAKDLRTSLDISARLNHSMAKHRDKAFNYELHEKRGLEIAKEMGIDCESLPPDFAEKLSWAHIEAYQKFTSEMKREDYQPPEIFRHTPISSNTDAIEKKKLENDKLLSDLFDDFCAYEKDSITLKSQRKKRAQFNEFLQIVGKSITVSSLNHELARYYIEIVSKLPPNYSKIYDPSPLKALELAGNDSEKPKDTTVNDKIRAISYFFNWCKDQGHFELIDNLNMLSGKSKKQKRGTNRKNSYEPFSNSDIKNIFGDQYVKLTSKKPHHFWLPLIGLFTGARISEIVQLQVNDIKCIDGIHYFEFCSSHDGKTANAHRTFPIHSTLIELGLLEHQKIQKKKKEDRLLSDISIPKIADNPGKNPSKWFNSSFLPKFEKQGLISPPTEGRRKVFHSFRGAVISTLRENRAELAYINTIIGHADSTMQGKYADEYSVEFKFDEVVSKLNYKDVDFDALKASKHAYPQK